MKKNKRSVAPLTLFWIPLAAGILIFSIAFGLLTMRDRQYLQSVLQETLTFMKNRIESYDHYQSADKTKSLVRLADKVEALNTELKLQESYDVQFLETLNRKPKGCKSSKKAWEREHEHGRRESCKLIVDCVLNSVSFSGFGRKTEYLTRKKQRIFERRKETETRLAP